MDVDALKLRRTRVRNEIAFLHSDRGCGGPDYDDDLKALRTELAQLDEAIAAADTPSHSGA